MRYYALAALAAGMLSSPALAQDSSPFGGFRVEGLVGYDMLKSGARDDGVDTDENDGDESIEGVGYGVGAGYDFDLGGVVAGIEGEYMESSGDAESDESLDGFSTRIGVGRDLYVGGRVGMEAGPGTLIYVKGGYTNTGVEAAFDNETDLFEFDQSVDGWRAGAGAEFLIGSNAYGKVEYRYSNYGDLEFNETEFERDIDLDRHQVVAGFGYRF